MNGANRPVNRSSFRRRAYRRRKIKYILLISVLVLAALFVIFLIVGNILDRKVSSVIASLDDLDKNNKGNSQMQEPHAPPESLRVASTQLSKDGSTLESRLSALVSDGFRAVSFELDTKGGDLLYSSPVAQELGYQSAQNELRRLDSAISKFDERSLYAVGITYVSLLDSSDDLSRTAAIGYYAAIIAEALRSGVDEVLILATNVNPDSAAELIRLADEVHRLVPDGKLGLRLSYPLPEYLSESALTEEKKFSDKLLSELWNAFDFFALDVFAADGSTPTSEEAEARIGELLYYALRYNMRVLIPSDDTVSGAISAFCEQRGLTNVQYLP